MEFANSSKNFTLCLRALQGREFTIVKTDSISYLYLEANFEANFVFPLLVFFFPLLLVYLLVLLLNFVCHYHNIHPLLSEGHMAYFSSPYKCIFLIRSSCVGEGNGNPLWYSCLENPMDGGAWWAAVHGVTKGRTQLSGFMSTVHFPAWEKEMATHSSVLAWRIPGTGEPGGLSSMGCTESDTTEVT